MFLNKNLFLFLFLPVVALVTLSCEPAFTPSTVIPPSSEPQIVHPSPPTDALMIHVEDDGSWFALTFREPSTGSSIPYSDCPEDFRTKATIRVETYVNPERSRDGRFWIGLPSFSQDGQSSGGFNHYNLESFDVQSGQVIKAEAKYLLSPQNRVYKGYKIGFLIFSIYGSIDRSDEYDWGGSVFVDEVVWSVPVELGWQIAASCG